MERILIKTLREHIGKEVTISGWVDVRRDHGKLIFFDIRDTSGIVQTVILPANEVAHRGAHSVRSEWVVRISGTVHKRPEKMINAALANGDIEMVIHTLEVLASAAELPFDREEKLNLDTYFDHLPLTLRTERARAIFRVQSSIIAAFREYLVGEGFTEFQAPKLIGEDAEGGASVFAVDYFGKKANLAQSPQFYKQIMVGVFERVFTTGNVYRAEKHSTTRHLNEYTSLDMEMGFINDHHDVMNLTEKLMAHIVKCVNETCAQELAVFNVEPVLIPENIPFMKLREAQRIIKDRFGEDCTQEPDLAPQHERWLSEYAKETYHSDFIFITHYPVEKRPMYVYEDENDPGYTKSFDLLFRGIEANTGGQRIHDYEKLIASMKRKGLDPEKFSFYLQAFKYGMPPHGGFGMGLERLTAKFLGLENVKEAALFPREINRIDTLLSS